jgi:hypothetical protein
MRKLLAGLCAGVLAFGLFGCGEEKKKETKKPVPEKKTETPPAEKK